MKPPVVNCLKTVVLIREKQLRPHSNSLVNNMMFNLIKFWGASCCLQLVSTKLNIPVNDSWCDQPWNTSRFFFFPTYQPFWLPVRLRLDMWLGSRISEQPQDTGNQLRLQQLPIMLVSASKFFTLEPYNEVQVIWGVKQRVQRIYMNAY